jgi:hypothetical protein
MKFQGIQQMKAILAAVALGIVLAGCSAGGKPDKTTGGGTSSAASLNVAVSKSTVSSTGTDTATITATALDSSNNVVSGAPISIKPDSGVMTASGTATDGTGTLTGTLGIGSDHTNRAITVTVTSGSIKKTVTVNVAGSTLSATAGTGTAGSTSTIQYSLVDAGAAPIVGAQVTVTVPGQTDVVNPTDADGKYAFQYTMPATTTTITAKAAGASVSTTVTPLNGSTVIPNAGNVTSASLSSNPSTVNTGQQVELRALFIGASNAPIPNVRVRFRMTDSNSIGGSLSSSSADGTEHNVIYSDADGVARATYTAGTRGGSITPKMCWSTTDFADADCTSTLPTDPAPYAVSSSNVTVTATGVSLAVLANGLLTPDNTKNIYSVPLVVQVVNASNQPISGSTVTGSVDIPRFYRGFYAVNGGVWTSSIYADNTIKNPPLAARQSCDNEDINRNNVMETGEDLNLSGSLEPFKASVVIVPTSAGSNVTDSFGKAYFSLQYGQNYASWEDVILTFTTTVEGTEGHATYPSDLPIPAGSLTTVSSSPPFATSPYNVAADTLPPWVVQRTVVPNPGNIYPSIANFHLCNNQGVAP